MKNTTALRYNRKFKPMGKWIEVAIIKVDGLVSTVKSKAGKTYILLTEHLKLV